MHHQSISVSSKICLSRLGNILLTSSRPASRKLTPIVCDQFTFTKYRQGTAPLCLC